MLVEEHDLPHEDVDAVGIVAEPPKKSGPRAPIDVSTDLRLRTQVPNNLTGL